MTDDSIRLFDFPQLPCTVHATCVSVDGCGLLIVGASGSGKSALALQMLALGAELVADDQCLLQNTENGIVVSRPPNLPQAIEARGLGLLSVPCRETSGLRAVLNVEDVAQDRMPTRKTCTIGNHRIPLLQNPVSAHGPASLYLYLKQGIHD